MIIPCIDLMAGKVVQLVQGRRKVLELPDPLAVLAQFGGFEEVQVIDLDAAMGGKPQSGIVRELCQRKRCRVGGGIRSVERAIEAVDQGAHKVIVGSQAFTADGINFEFLRALVTAVPREKLMIAVDCLSDHVAVRGWSELLPLTPFVVLPQLEDYCSEFLCTYIDAEGQLRGTDLGWFQKLRARTRLPITAAGGITTDDEVWALEKAGMNAALGMAIYRKIFPDLFARGLGS